MTDVRTFVEVRPGMKDRLRTAIEALVDVLDSLDSDPDLEDNGDDELTGDEEPSLGSTHAPDQNRAWQAAQSPDIDAEFEGNSVPECDREPTLGSLGSSWGGESRDQYMWPVPLGISAAHARTTTARKKTSTAAT